ncbi:MAG: DUF1365 domain-containing protein [Terracidiphilus sp.]
MMESAIYFGTLRHRRFHPKRHEFTYPLFMAYLNVDRIAELMRVSRFASHNRWNWATFDDRDHFGEARKPLRERLAEDAARQGLTLPVGKIFLLTHLRYLGYNFNPVSFFYCHDAYENLRLIMAEVKNTFGETQNYWLSTACQTTASNTSHSYEFDKTFHVSPFMSMACNYHWTFTNPGESLVVQTNVGENNQAVFDGTLKLARRPWSQQWLHHALTRFPWVTAKTIAAIHWEAVRLYWKKVPTVHHPGSGNFAPANTRPLGASWSIE